MGIPQQIPLFLEYVVNYVYQSFHHQTLYKELEMLVYFQDFKNQLVV